MPDPLMIAMLCLHSSPIGVLGTRDTGGMSVYVRALAGEMGRAGHQVDIFTLRRDPGPSAVRSLAPDVRLVMLDIGLASPPGKGELHRFADDFKATIEAFRAESGRVYDLVHSHYWISGQLGLRLGAQWDRAHAVTFHTLAAMKDQTGTGPPAAPRRLAAEKALVREADALLVACPQEKDNLIRCHGADPGRIMLVPGGVDLARFRPGDRAAARRRLGFAPQEFILLSVGRLAPLKGQARIIEALARLGADARLKLVLVGGDGPADPEQQRLQKLAARAGLAERVIFTGSVPHETLPAYYAAADVYVQASHYESFGLVGLEALACGRPVVTSPVGIMATLGGRSQPGCLLTDGSPDALAAGIGAVRRGEAAWRPETIRTAVQAFNWPQAAAAALSAYRRAIRRQAEAGAANQSIPAPDAGSAGHRDRPCSTNSA